MSKEEEKNFEELMDELNTLVKDLEQGNTSLDDSIEKYTKAMNIAKVCNDKLDNAQGAVNKILKELEETKAELAKVKDEYFTDDRQIELMLVDSGDGETRDVVYNFCDMYGDGYILPLKGFVSTIRTKEKWKMGDIKEFDSLSLVEIYVDLYKNTLARYLSQAEPVGDNYPDGWFTFANSYKDEYFRQLTTERKVKVKTPGGLVVTKWEQHGRNEAFDLNVYNLTACDLIIYQYSLVYLKLESANPRAVFEYMKLARGLKSSED